MSSSEPVPDRSSGLRQQTVSSVRWTSSGVIVLIALQLVYTVSISRLVDPASFGVVAAGMIAMQYFGLIIRLGLDSALIQRRDLHEADLAAATTIAVVAAVIGYAVLYLSSPVFGHLFEQPEVVTALRWMGLAMVVQTIAVVPISLLRREMAFRAISTIRVFAYLVSNIIVGLVAASLGYETGALILVLIASPSVSLVMAAYAARWRPRFSKTWPRISPFLRFGSSVSVASVFDAVGSTIDSVLVGRIGSTQLGQYSRATLLLGLPVEQLSTAGNQVIAPSLSRVQDDRTRFGSALGATLGLMSLAVLVPMVVGGAIAPGLVPIVLGDGWDLAAEVLPIVAIATALRLITQVITSAAEARGEVDARLRAQAVALFAYSIVVVIVVVVGPNVVLVAFGWLLGETFRLGAHLTLAVRRLGVDAKLLALRLVTAATVAMASAAPGFVLVRLLGLDRPVWVGLSMATGAAILAAIWFVGPRSQLRRDIESSGLLGRVERDPMVAAS